MWDYGSNGIGFAFAKSLPATTKRNMVFWVVGGEMVEGKNKEEADNSTRNVK